MRTKHAVTVALGLGAALALASPPARTQDAPFDGMKAHYWPHRKFAIPVSTETIAGLEKKPSHLQLYYALNRGAFQKSFKLPLGGLHRFADGKQGFEFEAPRDGEFEFAVQFVYGDGSVLPKTEALAADVRVVIDTVPPRVQLAPVGNGVEWRATDDNLDPGAVVLQCKWPTSAEWTDVKPEADRGPFRASDRYAWKMPPGKVLDVRVSAKDRAGHETSSAIVRVPADAGATVGLPKTGAPAWVGGAGGASLPQPRIDYVNALEFDVDYTVQRMGRSGVQAAHLFVLKEQGDWSLVKRNPVKLMPDDKGPPSLSLPYKAEREGTYGFYIIPESGAGKRADDPRKDDPPMVLVVVDTTKPKVEITGVQVKPGGVRGPLVEITWTATDPNLMPQPVDLEWSLDKNAPKWNELKRRLDNNLSATSGRHSWEVPDEKLWKFYVRARAVDKAANVGEHMWPQEVIVDLEKPAATIDRARTGPAGAVAPKAPVPDKEKEKEKPGSSDGPPPVPSLPPNP